MVNTMQKLFEDTVKDLYNAEKQFLKAMPKLSKAATSPDLKAALDGHAKETAGHVERLENVAQLLEIKPSGKVCKAAQGLVEEADEHLEEVEGGPVLDAAIILCAQKNEHYEICSYGTLITWAQSLGLNEVTMILQQTLAEEKTADASLGKVAKTVVNAKATETTAKKSNPASLK